MNAVVNRTLWVSIVHLVYCKLDQAAILAAVQVCQGMLGNWEAV